MKKDIYRPNILEIEIALSSFLNVRQNLIVPNISWGMSVNNTILHECDLLLCTKSGYLWEIEIKTSKADLIADKKKIHGHYNPNIKRLYFAIPEFLLKNIEHMPERAGIITVNKRDEYVFCKVNRKAKDQTGYKLTDKERLKMAKLGCMRIWNLKKKILKFNP